MDAYIAETGNCDDYPEPEEPAELSSYSSDQTFVDYDDERRPPTTPTTRRRPTPAPASRRSTGDDADGDGYHDDAYAPGADQDPAPTPDG